MTDLVEPSPNAFLNEIFCVTTSEKKELQVTGSNENSRENVNLLEEEKKYSQRKSNLRKSVREESELNVSKTNDLKKEVI